MALATYSANRRCEFCRTIHEVGKINKVFKFKLSFKSFRKKVDCKELDNNPGLYTKYKPYLRHDKSLFKKLLKMGQGRTDDVQNIILKRHFLDLTQRFMIPLER